MNTENPYEPSAAKSTAVRAARPSVAELIFDWATPALFAIHAVLSLLVFTSRFWLVFAVADATFLLADRLLILAALSPLPLAFAFMVWTFLSHRNLKRKFGFETLVFGSGAAFYSYFLPILGLILPYGFVNEIYRGYRLRSEGRSGEVAGGARVKDIKPSRFVMPWWIGFLLFGALFWVSLIVTGREGAYPFDESVFFLELAVELLRFGAVGFGFAMVLQINRLKRETYGRFA